MYTTNLKARASIIKHRVTANKRAKENKWNETYLLHFKRREIMRKMGKITKGENRKLYE